MRNRTFFRAVTFRSSFFFGRVVAQNKDIYRRVPLIEAGTFAQHQLFQKSCVFEKPTFPGELPFQNGHFFKRRFLLQQQPFQKSHFLTTYFFRRVAIRWLHKILWNCYFLIKLVFQSPYFLRTPVFLKQLYISSSATFSEDAVYWNSQFSIANFIFTVTRFIYRLVISPGVFRFKFPGVHRVMHD